METARKLWLKDRIKDIDWKAVVINRAKDLTVETEFNSKQHTLENVLHKIRLDMMTNLQLNIKKSIIVYIKRSGTNE